jgi:hypothetical protein
MMKNRMRCTFVMSVCVLTLSVETTVYAQLPNYVGAGSTLEGDYLRGAGIAAAGMGSFNLQTAQATSINVDTAIRLNEYLAEVVKESLRRYVVRRDMLANLSKDLYNKIQERLRNNPDEHDVMTGNALDVLLEDISKTTIAPSTLRSEQYGVPLPVDVIRQIPFRIPDESERFSLSRLSFKGKGKWPIALEQTQFDGYRHAYERAVDTVLGQAIEDKIQTDAITAVERAVEDLARKLDDVYGPSNDTLYREAKERIKEIAQTAELFKHMKFKRVIGELDKYSGTTVADLVLFMRDHHLLFGATKTPEERALYPELRARLAIQRDKVKAAEQEIAK